MLNPNGLWDSEKKSFIVRKPIVDACQELPLCHQIYDEGINWVCRAYIDPSKIQNRCGRHDACPIKPRPVVDTKKKSTLKRKFGKKGNR